MTLCTQSVLDLFVKFQNNYLLTNMFYLISTMLIFNNYFCIFFLYKCVYLPRNRYTIANMFRRTQHEIIFFLRDDVDHRTREYIDYDLLRTWTNCDAGFVPHSRSFSQRRVTFDNNITTIIII